ncbi:TetR/AcrR family transcriptional regulator [Sphingobium boeckii]|uniref:TetR/AcrR family hemagglutinin/protease transcriptional regulator n=1 Tax=Sphingobium boeckii TaxID=1082345 RepID=A0A7W9EEN3_9SPHN|nr:TetR/AcrR family transcriptional regulator [Sphingobium boeckii]MBB5684846.1 TetR/AcrR family hemagglutinin/protease transcriptional regulator [Sphingobium boeckii]
MKIGFDLATMEWCKEARREPRRTYKRLALKQRNSEEISAGPRRRTRKGSAARRAELLELAVKAFAVKGLRRAVHADVAALTDVSIPTIFRYFPTREALVSAVLEAVAAFWYGGVIARLPEDPDQNPRVALYAIVVSLGEMFQRNPEFATLWLEWSSIGDEDYWCRYNEFIDRDIAAYRMLIQRGKANGYIASSLDATAAARLIVGQSLTVAAMLRNGMPTDEINAFIRFYIDAALGFSILTSS